MTKEKHFNLFLSYSHDDAKWVQEFASVLKSSGFTAWDVNEVAPGENWQEAMQKALRESKTMVLCLSHHNVNSTWTSFELGAAIADHKKIIPILLENLDVSEVPLLLRKFQMLRPTSPTEAGKKVAEVVHASDELSD